MTFITVFIPVLALMALALLLLCIRILIKKNGKFSSQHIGENKAMKENGVQCAQTQDKMAQKGR